ncbi:hypothetical protein [Fictibacillus halophilus]
MIMWCGYSIVLFLSHHDHSFYETILLFMFGYFNFLVAQRLHLNKSIALNMTLSLTIIYITGKALIG